MSLISLDHQVSSWLASAGGVCGWWNSLSRLSVKHLPAINRSPLSHPGRIRIKSTGDRKDNSEMRTLWGWEGAVHFRPLTWQESEQLPWFPLREELWTEAAPVTLIHFSWGVGGANCSEAWFCKLWSQCGSLQVPTCEDLNTSTHVQASFCENKPTVTIRETGGEWTEHRLGYRTGFISTYPLLTLRKLLNFLEPQLEHL